MVPDRVVAMNLKTRALLNAANVGRMLRPPRSNPFPGVIGTFMGRDALTLAVSLLGLTPRDHVLLPAYLCGEVLRPFAGRSHVDFYDIRPDLTVEPDVISSKLGRTTAIRAVLIINYFGFLQPFRSEIKQMCAERGVVLIEDCAHSLLTEGSGESGDLSVYSFRKFLPLPDGGGLRVNAKNLTARPVFYPTVVSNGLAIGVVLRSLFNFRTDLLSRAWLASRRTNTSRGAPAIANGRTLPPSVFARNGMGNLSFTEIIQRRRADFLSWLEQTKGREELTPIFSHLPEGVCPLGFPVTATNRDALKSRLENAGISPTVEWRLPSAVGSEFVHSQALSAHMLTLPVYPLLGGPAGLLDRASSYF